MVSPSGLAETARFDKTRDEGFSERERANFGAGAERQFS